MDRPRLRSALPFVACGALGLGEIISASYRMPGLDLAAVLVVVATGAAAVLVSLRRAARSWIDPVPVYLLFAALALVVDATGGSASRLVPLTVLGLLWTSMFGTRRQSYVVAALTGVLFFGPILIVGGPRYPVSGGAQALLWTLIATCVCPAVQQTVDRWRVERERLVALRLEKEELLAASTLAAMVSTDRGGVVASFGAGAERMLGRRERDVVGRHGYQDFHDPDEVAVVAAELGVAAGFAVFAELARLEAPSRSWTYRREDGEVLFVRLAFSELHGSDGAVKGYLGVAIDATEAVRTRRELAAAESRWSVVMNSLPDATVITLDRELKVGLVTGAGALRVGLADASGRHMASVSKAANLPVIERLVHEALETGSSVGDLDATANGHEHQLLMTRLPGDEEEPEVLVLARDVSRERAREREVLESRNQVQRLFEHAPHGIVTLSPYGRVLEVNPSLCALLGRERGELVGSALAELSLRAGATTLQDHLAEVLASPSGRSEARWEVRTSAGLGVHVALTSTWLDGGGSEEDAVLVNVVDVSERVRHEAQLAHVADHDPLTGLANRRRFDAALQAHVDHVRRYGPRGAVLMLDLDHFKEVNDTLGHGVGDQLIVSLADLLRRRMRTTDLVARLGGDEFAILLSDVDRAGAEEVARDVVELVREHVASLDGVRRRVTVSVGGMLIDSVTLTPSDVMSMVDMMLYDAKDAGRDTYALLDSRLHEMPRTGARMQWNERIETALATDSFELHLQPILDVATDRVTGAEALLRMRDGDDLVLPATFLYVAERSHLVVELDRWVLRRAVPLLAELQRRDPGFRLEVNLSGKSVGDPAIERELVVALDEHQVDPHGLVLEITETAAVASIEEARAFAERLSELGCRFALDDFGAGFGSFYYLKHLLFDYVKIDGEFIATCDTNPTDRTIVTSIVQMAHGLGKQTIAEFVSSAAILETVRAAGVDHAQGYYVGRPTTIEAFLASLSTRAVGQGDPLGV